MATFSSDLCKHTILWDHFIQSTVCLNGYLYCAMLPYSPIAQALQNVAQEIDNAAETTPELVAVAEQLKDIADGIDKVVDDKIQTVQNRFSYATFREAAACVLGTLPPLNLRQRVMAVYHVGVGFFLQEERNQGAGTQGTIQGWPEQFIRENHELNQAVEDAGGIVSFCMFVCIHTYFPTILPCVV